MRSFSGNGKDQITEDKPLEEAVPPRGAREAWRRPSNKPEMGMTLFSEKGNYVTPMYIHLSQVRDGGRELSLYYSDMTVRIVGTGLEALAEGLRRHVIPYIQERHVSEFEAKEKGKYIYSIKILPPAEEGELGKWAE